MTTEPALRPHVAALNRFLAASEWGEALALLRAGAVSSRWAAWRCLKGAAEAHEQGEITARGWDLSSALAILCALDSSGGLDSVLDEQVSAFWSWAVTGQGPPPALQADPWLRGRGEVRVGLRMLGSCADLAQAADVIDELPELRELAAVGAAAVYGYRYVVSHKNANGDQLRFAAMLLERVDVAEEPEAPGLEPPIFRCLPPGVREPVQRSLAASVEQGEGQPVAALRAFAEAFAHPDAVSLDTGWLAALLTTAADDLYWLYQGQGMTVALDWSLAVAEWCLAEFELSAEARSITRQRCWRALSQRYEVHGDPSDLHRAVVYAESVLAESGHDSTLVGNLALTLRRRASSRTAAGTADLDRAIELMESVLASGNPEDLVNHALLLLTRHDHTAKGTRAPEVLERAAASAEAALTTATGRTRMGALTISAEILVRRIEAGPGPGAADSRWTVASARYAEAVRLAGALGPQRQLPEAVAWGLSAGSMDDWETADRAFAIALAAYGGAEARQISEALRDYPVPHAYGLPAAAAFAKIRLSQGRQDPQQALNDAVGILERHRVRQLVLAGEGDVLAGDRTISDQSAVLGRLRDR